MIGDTHTAALVSLDGSVDWLCLPRFDSPACFASLLGNEENGFWRLAPTEISSASRAYRDSTLVLDTTFETSTGRCLVTDFMPVSRDEAYHRLIRTVRVVTGSVSMEMEMRLRFEYGSIVPWVERSDRGITALAGANAVLFDSDIELHGENLSTVANFSLEADESASFCLSWFPSHLAPDPRRDSPELLRKTEEWWKGWASTNQITEEIPRRDAIARSFVTLKALTYAPTGALVAAPTTSLPESIGGSRNWDYRFCWLRDTSFVLDAFAEAGYTDEVVEWHRWLRRAIAGHPSQLSVMYGLMGDRLLTEVTLDWFDGYEGSRPVRIGNDAHRQFQLDVFGEVMKSFYTANENGVPHDDQAWQLVIVLMEFLEEHWQDVDAGIWEVRGRPQPFTHSRVMAWVAADRATRLADAMKDPIRRQRWSQLADVIHTDVCEKGFDREKNSFVQTYGSSELDASTLLIPAVGFLPATDPRVVGTVAAVERELLHHGLVRRYNPVSGVDGISEDEGVFLPCSFWLADCYAMMGQTERATDLFERLLGLCNDVGLISEEYDPETQRLLGNFPQALSHVAVINTARRIAKAIAGGERKETE